MRTFRQLVLLALVAVATMPAWGEPVSTTTREIHWSWDPGTTIPLALAALLYIVGLVRMRRVSAPIHWKSVACFAGGWVSLLGALNSPIHSIGDQLFWVHMTQHEILVLVSAPLLVLGRPLVPFLWALPCSWRHVAASFSRLKLASTGWAFLTAPLVAWTLHAAALWVWHAPALFDATLTSDVIHGLQHISFLGTALLFWWALIYGHGGRLSQGAALVYVFTTVAHTSILGALLTFSPSAWYHPYIATAPLWNLNGLQDQQLGGLIMWVPSGTLLTIIGLALLASWLRESDRRWEYTRTAALIRLSGGGAHEG